MVILSQQKVFSACAEMFLLDDQAESDTEGFLCIRRDVSYDSSTADTPLKFSLHVQRCFWQG